MPRGPARFHWNGGKKNLLSHSPAVSEISYSQDTLCNTACEATYVGDGVDVGSGQAEVTNHLEAPVVGSQVQWSSAILDKKKKGKRSFQFKTDDKWWRKETGCVGFNNVFSYKRFKMFLVSNLQAILSKKLSGVWSWQKLLSRIFYEGLYQVEE